MTNLSHVILETSEILKQEFNIRPEKTKLYIYEDINKFLQGTKNPQAQSMFLPKDLSAHVPKERLDLIFHEYFGHGLYCEYTSYGKKMVNDENKYHSITEDEIIRALQYHDHLKPDFEGHALWTEEFLLKKVNKEDVLERRLKELDKLHFSSSTNPRLKTQKDVYNRVKLLENKYGKLHLWYYFGFPKILEKEKILEVVKERLKSRFNSLEFVISFGSRNVDKDLDLCIVLKDGVDVGNYANDEIEDIVDMPQYNKSEFIKRAKLFDIVITEPIITGDLIYGNEKEFMGLWDYLLKFKPSDNAIRYLEQRIRECHRNSSLFFSRKDMRSLLKGLLVSSYALSYELCLDKYKNGSGIVKFSEILSDDIVKIRNNIKKIEDLSNHPYTHP